MSGTVAQLVTFLVAATIGGSGLSAVMFACQRPAPAMDRMRMVAVQAQMELDGVRRELTRIPDELARLSTAHRDGEPFTAISDCPKCGHLAVHWLSDPHFKPTYDDTPASRGMRQINASIEYMAIVSGGEPWRYDPPGTVVGRDCIKCGYHWGQR